MTIEELIEEVTAYFSDTSRSRSETREGLECLSNEIEVLLDTLDDDEDDDEWQDVDDDSELGGEG